MAEAKVLMSRNGDLGVIKIVGVGNFQGAVAFKASYSDMIAAGVGEFVIDLSECEMLDSTFLGIILGLTLKLRQMHKGPVHVIHANEMVRNLFRGTGLDQLFDTLDPGQEPPNDPSI